jgi:ribosomal protein S27AE
MDKTVEVSQAARELLPCPFCGSESAHTVMIRDGRRAVCGKCGSAAGPYHHGILGQPTADERARAAWNTRATPSTDAVREAVGREEQLAQFLHDEGGFDEAWGDRTWPEHPGDTGQREGGFVKIVTN